MTDIDLPEQLVQAQRAVDAAWSAVAAHRAAVTARRRADAAGAGAEPDSRRPWAGVPLPWWTGDERARYDELHAVVVAAAESRRAVIDRSGLGHGADVVAALHAAARRGVSRSWV